MVRMERVAHRCRFRLTALCGLKPGARRARGRPGCRRAGGPTVDQLLEFGLDAAVGHRRAGANHRYWLLSGQSAQVGVREVGSNDGVDGLHRSQGRSETVHAAASHPQVISCAERGLCQYMREVYADTSIPECMC